MNLCFEYLYCSAAKCMSKKEWMRIHWPQWYQSVAIKNVGREPDYLIITLCAKTPYVWKLETTIKCINDMIKIQLWHIVFVWHRWYFFSMYWNVIVVKQWSSIYMPAGKIISYLSTAVIKRSGNVCGQPQHICFS